MILLYFLCSLPTAWHLYDDRKGDGNKAVDIVVMAMITAGLAGIGYIFDVKPILIVICAIAWHILIFDYAIVYLLRKNNVITPKAEVFKYVGESSKVWDRLIDGIDWRLRIAIRAAVFAGCTVIYFYV